MSYQVLARKWRPQRFDDVVGQRGVTQTLRNALTGDRIAQAFVFAGPRGVGKTTTARILSRALNCEKGPTPDPCGECDACREIAEGRDMDVLEIDAATHTQVDNVREVIIAGLAMAPVRDRYKIFVIDEVHQLSNHSFNALLKSIEEPPPHVVFMMATTELGKIPDTITSRAQVYEFRTIGVRAIADQLRTISDAEGLEVDDAALALVARTAEGSMRDAESALDQVIAFAAGERITADDVASVLGLVSRDLLFEIMDTVADERAGALFDLVGQAVEAGYDLRLLCRELSRLTRDLLVVSVDPTRLDDPEIAPDGDRDRLSTLSGRYSREDLMRAFDLLMRAEAEVKFAAEPRYSLEMALVRWVHVRKLVPLEQIMAGLEQGGSLPSAPSTSSTDHRRSRAPAPKPARRSSPAPPASKPAQKASPTPPAKPTPEDSASPRKSAAKPVEAPARSVDAGGDAGQNDVGQIKDELLAEIRRTKKFLYNAVVAQAQKIECEAEAVTFTFAPAHRTLLKQLEHSASFIADIASRLTGRPVKVLAVQGGAASADAADGATGGAAGEAGASPGAADAPDLKTEALGDSTVQAMLEVFPAEIRDVEEIG